MMPTNAVAAVETFIKRQRAEAHGAQSHARWLRGYSVSHGLLFR